MQAQIIYKDWGNLPFSVYKELLEIKATSWESNIQMIIEESSLFIGCSPDDPLFDTLEVEQLYEIHKGISWCNSTPPEAFKSDIEYKEVPLKFIDINAITIGTFIDIEHFLKNDPHNLPLFNGFFYRQYKQDEWGNIEFEPYKYNIIERSKWFNEVPVPHLYAGFKKYIKWRDDVVSAYSTVFEDPNWDQIEGEDQLPSEEVQQIKKEIEAEKKKAPHSWIGILLALSNGNIATFPQLFELPAILVFNILSAKKALKI
jgi:hypothetical protein